MNENFTPPVLLGLLDETLTDCATDFTVNKIGGFPDWTSDVREITCRRCSTSLVLIAQIYCPLHGSNQHRVLYIFACTAKSCRNKVECWRAIRSQRLDDTYNTTTQTHAPKSEHETVETEDWGHGADDWGHDADDWGQTSDDWNQSSNIVQSNDEALANVTKNSQGKRELIVSSLCHPAKSSVCDLTASRDVSKVKTSDFENALARTVDGLSISKTSQPVNQSSPSSCLLSYYINVFDEPSAPTETFDHEKKLLQEYALTTGESIEHIASQTHGGRSAASGAAECYEKADVPHGDRIFHRFMKRISRVPDQILRYQYGGKPLWLQPPAGANVHDDVIPPPCQQCGSERVFELQLMPALVYYLKISTDSECAVEFGSVIVYTCSASCWSVETAIVDEHVILQTEPELPIAETAVQ